MDSSVLVAIITGAFAFAGVVISNATSNRKNSIEQAKRDTALEDRMQNIEHKLDIHNGYAEKLGEINLSLMAMQKDIEYLKK